MIIDPEYHYETVNVEAQQANPHSLLWWMKRLIALRQQHPVLGRGTMEFLNPRNRKVLAFIRRLGDEAVLVVANLSRFVQYVELDLSSARGMIAVELFGGTPFPRIGELPYLLTLGPHAFYWFALTHEPSREAVTVSSAPTIHVAGGWMDVLEDPAWDRLAEALPRYLAGRRWFAGKARDVKGVSLVDAIPLPANGAEACIALVQVTYREGAPETYQLVLGFASGERAEQVKGHAPAAVIAELLVLDRRREAQGVLYDVVEDHDTALMLLDLIARQRRLKAGHGEVSGKRTRGFRPREIGPGSVEPRPLSAEQSNSSVVYGERLVLKLFRKVDEGVNPDLEIGLMLSERAKLPSVPPLAGFLEYRAGRRHCSTLAALQGFVPNEGDAWEYTTAEVGRCVAGLDPADEPLGVERTVGTRTGQIVVTGRIDRLDERRLPHGNRVLVVVDYKTGRRLLTTDDARTSMPLALYALAAGRMFHHACRQVELHHLPTATVHSWEHSAESMDRHVRRAESIAAECADADERFRAGLPADQVDRVFAPRPGPACGWCDYRALCPEGTAAAAARQPWDGLAAG